MPVCDFTENCVFFSEHMFDKSLLVNTYKTNYCWNNFSSCARYIVRKALGSDSVPLDLYPHNNDRAAKIISEKI